VSARGRELAANDAADSPPGLLGGAGEVGEKKRREVTRESHAFYRAERQVD
jgi:hypothetical protein